MYPTNFTLRRTPEEFIRSGDEYKEEITNDDLLRSLEHDNEEEFIEKLKHLKYPNINSVISINSTSPHNGKLILGIAVEMGRLNTVMKMVEHGADILKKDASGRIAIQYTQKNTDVYTYLFLKMERILSEFDEELVLWED